MELKKVYLDRPAGGLGEVESALEDFSRKLRKADRQLACGMERYGGFDGRRRVAGFCDGRGGTAMFRLQCRRPALLTNAQMTACHDALRERVLELDSEQGLAAVDAVVVYLDYALRGFVFQRPILALHRAEDPLGAWANAHPYLDYLISQHDVRRHIGPPYPWLPSELS